MMNLPYGMQNYGMGTMGSQYPQFGQELGRPAPLAAYTSRKKDEDIAVVGAFGVLALVASALLLKGKGIKEILKSSKNVGEVAKSVEKAAVTAEQVAVGTTAATVTAKTAATTAEKIVNTAEETVTTAKKEGFFSKLFAKKQDNKEFNNVIKDSKEYSKTYKNRELSSIKPAPQAAAPAPVQASKEVAATAQQTTVGQNLNVTTATDVVKAPQVSPVQNSAAAATVAQKGTLVLTPEDMSKYMPKTQVGENVATTVAGNIEKTSQIASEVKPITVTKVSKSADEVYLSNRETPPEIIINQGNKGKLSNAKRRNAERNYSTEVKNGLHVEPAITLSEKVKYSAGIAYQPASSGKASAIANNNKEVAEAKASANQIGNLISKEAYEKLMKSGK